MPLVLIRGAGEMASGTAHRLLAAGYRVIMTELLSPWRCAGECPLPRLFSPAAPGGRSRAVHANSIPEALTLTSQGKSRC